MAMNNEQAGADMTCTSCHCSNRARVTAIRSMHEQLQLKQYGQATIVQERCEGVTTDQGVHKRRLRVCGCKST